MPLITYEEHARRTCKYHTSGAVGHNGYATDPAWAKRWLDWLVVQNAISEEAAASIRADVGWLVQRSLFPA